MAFRFLFAHLSKIFANYLQDEFYIVVHRPIFETDDFDALSFQIVSPLRIIHIYICRKVRRTIQFDGEPAFGTEKVDNIATNTDLPPKFLTQKLPPL